MTTSSYLAPAIFVLYLCKYLLSGGKILNNLILEFRSKELGYIFFGSVILKTFISYGLRDFLQTLLSIGLVEWTVVALEMLSLAALVILLARLVLKTIPR